MIFVVLHTKMTVTQTQNLAIQVQEDCHETESRNCFYYYVAQIVARERTQRQAVGDLLVTFVALPLLVTCALLLYSCMRTDWVRDDKMRLRVLALGISLLLVSLLVCVYATQRLGMCVWPSAEQQALPEGRVRRRTLSSMACPAPLLPSDSQMQLMVRGDLPPSYDSVIGSTNFIPPYCTINLCAEKGETEVTRSSLSPYPIGARPPGTG